MTINTLEQNMSPAFELTQKNQPLHDSVRQALENFISKLKGGLPSNLYELILGQVEAPLLEAVMEYTKNNQSRAAILLGLSRGTLRKKLKQYGMLE
jgi:Fis family transcriptional regulator, factor for inversion stimulation protein